MVLSLVKNPCLVIEWDLHGKGHFADAFDVYRSDHSISYGCSTKDRCGKRNRARNFTRDASLLRTSVLSIAGLAPHYFWALYTLGRVARVHDQLGLRNDLPVIVVRMVGNDEDAIVLPQPF